MGIWIVDKSIQVHQLFLRGAKTESNFTKK